MSKHGLSAQWLSDGDCEVCERRESCTKLCKPAEELQDYKETNDEEDM